MEADLCSSYCGRKSFWETERTPQTEQHKSQGKMEGHNALCNGTHSLSSSSVGYRDKGTSKKSCVTQQHIVPMQPDTTIEGAGNRPNQMGIDIEKKRADNIGERECTPRFKFKGSLWKGVLNLGLPFA